MGCFTRGRKKEGRKVIISVCERQPEWLSWRGTLIFWGASGCWVFNFFFAVGFYPPGLRNLVSCQCVRVNFEQLHKQRDAEEFTAPSERVIKSVQTFLKSSTQIRTWILKLSAHWANAHSQWQHSRDESPWLVKRLVNRHIWCHWKPTGV